MDITVERHPEVCDFCCSPAVRWWYPARDFVVPPVLLSAPAYRGRSVGEWAACEPCRALIDANDRAALAGRTLEYARRNGDPCLREHSAAKVLEAIQNIQRAFFQHRAGPARRTEEATMAEPCLICTPVEQLPEELRELARYMQQEFPTATHLMHVELPPGREGLNQCWNCEGRGTVRRGAPPTRVPPPAGIAADPRVVFDLLDDLRFVAIEPEKLCPVKAHKGEPDAYR